MLAETKLIDFKTGIKDALPICVAFFFLFISIGGLANQHTYTLAQASVMSMVIFAAPLQAALLQLKNHDLILITVILSSFIVNFRFFIMSTTLLPYFKNEKTFHLLFIIPLLSASTFAVSYTKFKNQTPTHPYHYYMGVALPSYFVALCATILGYILAKDLNSPYIILLLSMILPIHFTALTALNWPKILPIVTTILGFSLTPLINIFLPKAGILISPLLAGLFASLFIVLKEKNMGYKWLYTKQNRIN